MKKAQYQIYFTDGTFMSISAMSFSDVAIKAMNHRRQIGASPHIEKIVSEHGATKKVRYEIIDAV